MEGIKRLLFEVKLGTHLKTFKKCTKNPAHDRRQLHFRFCRLHASKHRTAHKPPAYLGTSGRAGCNTPYGMQLNHR